MLHAGRTEQRQQQQQQQRNKGYWVANDGNTYLYMYSSHTSLPHNAQMHPSPPKHPRTNTYICNTPTPTHKHIHMQHSYTQIQECQVCEVNIPLWFHQHFIWIWPWQQHSFCAETYCNWRQRDSSWRYTVHRKGGHVSMVYLQEDWTYLFLIRRKVLHDT